MSEHIKKAVIYSSGDDASDQLSEDELHILEYLLRHRAMIAESRFHERLDDRDPYGALAIAKACLDDSTKDALRFGAILGWVHFQQIGRYDAQ